MSRKKFLPTKAGPIAAVTKSCCRKGPDTVLKVAASDIVLCCSSLRRKKVCKQKSNVRSIPFVEILVFATKGGTSLSFDQK